MSAATDRLTGGYYNSLPRSASNPGGMDDGGHVENFPAALVDVGTAAEEMIADNAARKAEILADNDATQAAIEADNDATALAVAGSAATAVAARDTAVSAKDTAVAKAAEAATSSATALRQVVANFPDRLDATAYAFTEALTGDPSAVASAPGGKIVNAAGFGYVYQAAGAATLAHKGLITAGAEYVIEVAVEIEQTVIGAGETPAARIRLQGLDKDYASTGAAVTSPLVVTPVGVTVISYRFAYVAPAGGMAWPQPGVALWLRPAVDINRKSDDSGAAAGSTARVRRLTVRDVTAVVAAELAAASAAAAAAAVTFSTQAEAEAGVVAGTVMSPLQTAQAIGTQAITIGGMLQAMGPPGARFLLCDGASYLKSSYPTLAAQLGDRYASWLVATPTVKAGWQFVGLYAETNLVIATGLNGNINTSPDGGVWTERVVSTAAWAYGRGAVKAAAKYFVYGEGTSPSVRCLLSSANGTTGWADVASFGSYAGGGAVICSMAYGVLNGAATLIATGCAEGGLAQSRYSTDEGVTWSNGADWTGSNQTSASAMRLVLANGVLGFFAPGTQTFKRLTDPSATPTAVTAIAGTITSVDVGNNLFVVMKATGEVYTSPDLVTFTLRDAPNLPTLTGYLGYFNGAHHFKAVTPGGAVRVYATSDFTVWNRVQMPQTTGSVVGPLRPFGASKAVGVSATTGVVAVASFAHNPATEFPVPAAQAALPTYIKAL